MTLRTSVVVPCYNVDAFLPAVFDSIKAQTRPVHEVVLVDDGSAVPIHVPDGWNGPPVQLIRTPNRGLPAARNLGVQHATGELVGFLDADDVWLPGKVEAQTRALEADPGAVACYTRCLEADGFFGFGPYPPPGVPDDEFLLVLWYNLFFPPSAVVARREALAAVGGFREDLGNGEDIELWLRLLRLGRFAQVPEPLTGYRRHPQQFTGNLARKLFGSKQARAVMIAEHADRLARAGVPRNRLWDAYRNDILLVYYRRQFGPARRLLFDYYLDHPADLRILAYAAVSLLPPGLIARVRGQLPAGAGEPGANGSGGGTTVGWDQAVRRAKHALRR